MSDRGQGHSRPITTNQSDIHDNLLAVVEKYRRSVSLRPVSQHTQDAFDRIQSWAEQPSEGLIFDSCCGVGESTARIAEIYPGALVIGIDKSEARVNKHQHYQSLSCNYQIIRADVHDFWRLAQRAGWQLKKHYLLYPNPYPKASQLQKRWHAGPSLPALIELGGELQVRSNWQIYTQEFALALQAYNRQTRIEPIIGEQQVTTPFERKYTKSDQQCWRLISQL